MRSRIFPLCVLVAVVLTLASCLNSDDDETTTYNDMAVTQFTLGTLNRYVHTTSSSGADSVYKATVTGSNYPMTIDHLGREIYNRDSLPLGTDVAHVLCTIATRNNGVVYFKAVDSDTLWLYYATDSLDFSNQRLMRVFATDGSGSRDYTVSLRVKTVTDRKLLWTEQDAQATWPVTDAGRSERAAAQGLALVGSSSKELFALNADKDRLMVSADDGLSWSQETLDADARLLPSVNTACATWPFEYNDNADYTLLVGESEAVDSCLVVWRKIAEYDSPAGQPTGKWAYMPLAADNPYYLPHSVQVSLAYFDETVLAFASDGNTYQSRDKGITWKPASAYTMPDGVSGRVEVAVGTDGRLWLRCPANGRVWSGYMQK